MRIERSTRGFTLVEVVIAIAIIGILATIAMPSYQAYLYRAKATEIVVSLDAVKLALIGAEVEHGQSVGDQLLVATDLNLQHPLLVGVRGQSTPPQQLPGVGQNLLRLNDIGIEIRISAGVATNSSPGQYLARLYWNDQPSQQVALAAIQLLQPQLVSSQVGSSVAELNLSLHGSGGAVTSTAPSSVTQPQTTPTPSNPASTPATAGSGQSSSTSTSSAPTSSTSSTSTSTTGTSTTSSTSGSGHGNSDNAPGHTGNNPGHGGTPPGQP